MHSFFDDLEAPLHIAHRGGAALAPENTLPAFRLAHRQYRTNMLELDLHLTLDGVLVVSHDATLDRCTNGEGAIAATRFGTLQGVDAGFRFSPDGVTFPFRGQGVRIPRFEDVLQEFPALPINVELKAIEPQATLALVELLTRKQAQRRVLCGSADDGVAAALRRALPDTAHYFPQQALFEWVAAVKSGEMPPPSEEYAALDLPFQFQDVRVVDEALLRAAERAGLWVNVWTVDDEASMRELVSLGVGGIMTDRPDLLRVVLDEAPRRRV